MEHIEMKNSLESELQIVYICSIRTRSRTRDINPFNFDRFCDEDLERGVAFDSDGLAILFRASRDLAGVAAPDDRAEPMS